MLKLSKIKICLFLLFLIYFFPSYRAQAASCSSISQYGITWMFNSSHECGQFINGDWWVVDGGSGITVTSVSPAPTAGQNGSMVNPPVGKHAYDEDEIYGYDASLAVSFPLILRVNDSLVSTISRTSETAAWDGSALHASLQLKSAAVLTCLSSIPPSNSFRPPFFGVSKPLKNLSQVNTQWMPELPKNNIAEPSHGGFANELAYLERGLQRPWISLPVDGDQQPRAVSPFENMLDYHQEIGTFFGEASLYLLTNTPGKNNLLYLMIQNGLDYYNVARLSEDGGVGTSSMFKISALIAGLSFNDNDILTVFSDGLYGVSPRDEDKIYYWADKTALTTSAIVTPGQTWTGETVFFRKDKDIYGPREYEHLYPSEWPVKLFDTYKCKGELYRQCCDSQPHLGMVLAAQILENRGHPAKNFWSHNAAFDYLDRWMNENFINSGKYSIMTNESGCSIPTYNYGSIGGFADD